MIKIRIPEISYTDDPQQPGYPLSDCVKFLIGFKYLCNKINMHKIDTVNGIPIRLNFDDGSYIGILKLFQEVGFK